MPVCGGRTAGRTQRLLPKASAITLRRVIRFRGIALVVLGCALSAVTTATAATSPATPRAAMLKAASAKHSVHYVETGSGVFKGQHWTQTQVADVAGGRGVQRITIKRSGKTGHVTIRV